ncbi:uncharacterized protein LOC128214474 [Mya arenaria]|uniref:uncharacterized protein LOC128214474 n=1 Tax=Mya arenaria TaxID=6604 RepID=UPI0022E34062|nr:uncharacterized protein LOC128214474 [Mya arenaria]
MAEPGADLERCIKHLAVKESPESEEDGKKEVEEESTGAASSVQTLRSNKTNPEEYGVQNPNTASLPTPTETHLTDPQPEHNVIQRRIKYKPKRKNRVEWQDRPSTSNETQLYIGKYDDGYTEPCFVVVKEAKNCNEIKMIEVIEQNNNNPIVAKLKHHEKHGDIFVLAFERCEFYNIIDHISTMYIDDRAYTLIENIIRKVKKLHEMEKPVTHGDIRCEHMWISVKGDDVQVMLAGLEKASTKLSDSNPFEDDIVSIEKICYIIIAVSYRILVTNGGSLNLKHENVDLGTIRNILDGKRMTAAYHCLTDLLKAMVDDPAMSLKKIENHPFFWDAHRCLSFMRDAFGKQQVHHPAFTRLDRVEVATVIDVDNWYTEVSEISTKSNFLARGDYNGESMVDLIRYIRNVDCHFSQDKNGRNVSFFGQYPQGLVKYFNEKFPKLFIFLYRFTEPFTPRPSEQQRTPQVINAIEHQRPVSRNMAAPSRALDKRFVQTRSGAPNPGNRSRQANQPQRRYCGFCNRNTHNTEDCKK